MLKIFYGDMDDVTFTTAVYFNNVYKDEWITDPLSEEMIADIDRSIVTAGGVIDSPVLGKIPPTKLSGSVKTLILINNRPDQVFTVLNGI